MRLYEVRACMRLCEVRACMYSINNNMMRLCEVRGLYEAVRGQGPVCTVLIIT